MSLAKKIEQKRRAKKVAERNKKMKLATAGIAAGLTAGALGGILLAPKSGKETRANIKDKSKHAKARVDEKLNIGKANIDESKKRIKEYLQNRKNQELNLENHNTEVAQIETSEKVEA
jgi:gas vesicle protein